jgi:putative oxidoreductase
MERPGFLHAIPPIASAIDTCNARDGVVDRSWRSTVLLAGWYARAAAFVMFLYLGIVSVLLNNFWVLHGASAGGMQTQFLKNLGIMGGLLMLAASGPGKWSLDRYRGGALRAIARG